MNKLLLRLVASIFFFSISVILIGCSNELTITSPTDGNNNIPSTNSITSIDKSDTMVYLPISKMKISIEKGLSVANLIKIDKYLSTHKVSKTVQNKIIPMLPQCGTHYTQGWLPQNLYRSVPNKYLGIWQSDNIVTLSKAYNIYGFNSVLITDVNNISNARNGGFHADSIMFGLSAPLSTALPQIISSSSSVGSYYIDEPLERENFNYLEIKFISALINSKKLFLGSWKIPPYSDYGSLSQISNVFLMCDQYNGDCSNTYNDYWNVFRGYYVSKSISNWVNIVTNNGTGFSHVVCWYKNDTPTNFNDLFINANIYGENSIWLYCFNTGDETGVSNYCSTAWSNGWLLRGYQYAQIEWTCDDQPCQSCVWGSGDWSIENIIYNAGYSFEHY